MNQQRLFGEWDKNSAGGNHSWRSWGSNPHFRLDVAHRGMFLLKVSCTDRGFYADGVESYLVGMNLLPGQTTQDRLEFPIEFPESVEGQAQNHLIHTTLDPGTYWVVPDCFDPGVCGKFYVHVASPTPFQLAAAPKSDYMVTHTAHGVVDEPYGHPDDVDGCPRMVLKTHRPCKITARMQCDKKDPRVVADAAAGAQVLDRDKLAIKLHMCEGQATYGLDNSVAESPYLISDSVSITVELDVAGVFTLVPKPVFPRAGGAPHPMGVAVTVDCTDLQSTLGHM